MFLIDRENNKADSIDKKTFKDLNFEEKKNLQEWIAKNPKILGEDLLIIQKEFSDWSDTNERLDLLALDLKGNIVVIENKLDDSGRDVVWQALKYVSYCATLKKTDICRVYQDYLGNSAIATEKIAEFYDVPYDDALLNPSDGDQRIILVAANFRKEVTSTALWLISKKVDITCVKVTPYEVGEQIYLESKKVLPIQDIEDYQVKLSEKKQEDVAQKARNSNRADLNKLFWEAALPVLREITGLYQNVSPPKDHWLSGSSGYSGIYFTACVFEKGTRAELYIATGDKDKNKKIFRALEKNKSEHEKIFGHELYWQELPDKKASRISFSDKNIGIIHRENWDLAIEFLSENITKLHTIFMPSLDKELN